MKAIWGKFRVDVYPVESFIYEVVANGKKEFYQNVWDAFRSGLHMNNPSAQIIKIPVIPISDSEIKAEATAFTLGEKRDHLEGYVKEFRNNPNKITVKKELQNQSQKISKKRLAYLWVFLGIACWLFVLWELVTNSWN